MEHIATILLHGRPYQHTYWDDVYANTAGHNLAEGYGYCSLGKSSCFDPDPCVGDPYTIYIYPEGLGLEKTFSWLAGEHYKLMHKKWNDTVVRFLKQHPLVRVVNSADDACLLLPRMFVHTRSDAWEGFALWRLRSLPYWDDGRNHIIIDPGDHLHASIPADKAIFTRSAFHQAVIRPGYDVQTLYLPEHRYNLRDRVPANAEAFLDRPLLLSFKGAR